ncbi:hypothetical protein FCULG_00012248 [Fusarium culmorum]|uniref:NACHT domain-containing protein n=1 Tax=Fusarium culmorum TaxID=5516 RepID=A0A2T4GFG4_FUSCU|nr:hypothetical protein FCULG_00012248 [Fusarium culmorum]
MDPLSLSASIAGLISVADLTFRLLYKYVRGVKEAQNDIKSLKREIEGLCSVLRILQALAEVLVTEEDKGHAALSVDILDQCKETLGEISNKVQGAFATFEQKRLLKATLQKLKWPFGDVETKGLLDTLSRYKLTISIATSADSLSKLHILLNNQVQHNIKIEETVKNIDKNTKLIANIELDKEKRRILDFFMKPTLNPRHNLDQSIELRHPTTGSWFMSSPELQSWFTDYGSLLWLNGIGGGGKTILAGLVIQKAMSRTSDEVGVAFFFCDYKNTATLRLEKILGAISVQLALQNDASYEILERYHEDLNPPNELSTTPDVDGLESAIASMIKTFRQVLIVVDGLDECGDEMGSVTMSLAAFASLDTPASVALFSRQEPDIRARMGNNVTKILIEAHTDDIEIYVRAELEKRIQSRRLRLSDPETAQKIEEELIGRAQGMQRELEMELPFYPRAAAYWPMLMRASPNDFNQPFLQDAVASLFCNSYSPHFRFWVYWFLIAVHEAKYNEYPNNKVSDFRVINYKRVMNIALDDQLGPLHLAAALNMPELCQKLMENGADPSLRCRLGHPLRLAHTSLLSRTAANLHIESTAFLLLLPSAEHRAMTVKCLMKDVSLLEISDYPFLFSIAFVISCYLQDFRPIIELLSNGITPTTSDIDLFASYLTRWWTHYANRSNVDRFRRKKVFSNFEASFRALNKHLADTSAFEQEWGFSFGKILWTKAVAMNLSFTRDPSLTHREISISFETLRERIMLAISNDSADALSDHLEDRRVSVVDSWSWNNSPSQTLLHHATSLNALSCVSLLLSMGCDPYARNSDGVPALHGIDMTKNGIMIDLFLAHHVSLMGTDTKQRTLWHVCAYRTDSSADFMLKLFTAKPEETKRAVLTKADDGNTPMTLVLSKKTDSPFGFDVLEDHALSFIKYCDDVSGFWVNHDPLLPQAFRFGSTKVMRRLFSLGIKPGPFVAGSHTPLHELDAKVSPTLVKFLMETFPRAVESRYSDRLPIDSYTDACVKAGEPPHEKVFEMLVSNTILQSRDQNGLTPWEYSIYNINRSCDWDEKRMDASASWMAVGLVWSNYVNLGAVRAHEEVSGGCGTGKLLSAIFHDSRVEGRSFILNILEPDMIDKAISSSKSWNPFANDVISLLQVSVQRQKVNMVKTLLKHGVDVHQRLARLSTIELVCDYDIPIALCSTERGRNIIELILNHSDNHKLGEFAVDGTGRGLLHRMASLGQEPRVRWLMEELIRRGVDINGIDYEAEPRFRWTPLIWHLSYNSTCYAGYLLELGADPGRCQNRNPVGDDVHYFDAISIAVYHGHISWLRQLLKLSRTTMTKPCWTRLLSLDFVCGKNELRLECNNLHIACYKGHDEIVEFFVENELIDYNTTTQEGITPLHLAALGGHSSIINYIIAQGQEVDVMTTTRVTPLHYAAANGHLEATKALLSKHAQGSIAAFSWTPRIAASDSGNKDIVDLLDNIVEIYDESKLELVEANRHKQKLLRQLSAAIKSGNLLDCITILPKGCPIDDPIPHSGGSTPLYLALVMNQSLIVADLLSRGASTLTYCHSDRQSVVEYAALNNSLVGILPSLLDQYLRQGGDLTNGPDSPLFFAAKNNVEGVRILLSYIRNTNKQEG